MSSFEQYGKYLDSEGSFELAEEPPRKWSNLHYNEPGENEILSEATNVGDGTITVRDMAGNTCELVGRHAKYLYIRDDESNLCFTPWGSPIPTPTKLRTCQFHPVHTTINSTCAELRVIHRIFIPRREIFEAWTTTLQNLTDRPRKVSLFAYAHFQLTGTNANGDPVGKDNHSEVQPDICGVFIQNRSLAVLNYRFNGYLVTLNRAEYVASSGYRDFFTRESLSPGDPKILTGWNCDNKSLSGPDCAAIVQIRFNLPPRFKIRADFLLGQAKDLREIRSVLERTTPTTLDQAVEEQSTVEKRRTVTFSSDTGKKNFDNFLNYFSKRQTVRDLISTQDISSTLETDAALTLFDYPLARANCLRVIATQNEDGSFPHGFRPAHLGKPPVSAASLLFAVPWMIKESGDFSILDEVAPYEKSPTTETVWEHLLRSIHFLSENLGPNGLCNESQDDTVDGLDPATKTGSRESVLVTEKFCLGLIEMQELALRRGDKRTSQQMKEIFTRFHGQLNKVAWDGEWYARAINANGYRLGSLRNSEGRIFTSVQSWAVLSQIAPPDRAKSSLEVVDRFLESDYGLALVAPAFSKYDERIGQLSAARPLTSENGAAVHHAAAVHGIADCLMGRPERAWALLQKITPDSAKNPVSNSLTEPFTLPGGYSLGKDWPGLTLPGPGNGVAPWYIMLAVEWILGARRHYDGLLINPSLSREVPRAKVIRTFRGARYEIEIDNTVGRCVGTQTITLNGSTLKGNILPDMRSGTHFVKVVI